MAVNFTDESVANVTSWSWTFGDGGTSTAQNPSHTYTSTGYYSPSLTVYNSLGANTKTKASYITACNEVLVYPTTVTMPYPAGGNQHYTGSLSNLQTADGNCMLFYSDTTGGGIADVVDIHFVSATGYTQSQILGSMVEYRAMTNDAGDTCCKPSWNCPACAIHPMPSQLTTWSWTKNAQARSIPAATRYSIRVSIPSPPRSPS